MSSASPTLRQLEYLALIDRKVREQGYPPTIREFMEELKIRSTNAISEQLAALERKGLLIRVARDARALKITDLGMKYLAPAAAPTRSA